MMVRHPPNGFAAAEEVAQASRCFPTTVPGAVLTVDGDFLAV